MPGPRRHILYFAEFSTGGSIESLLCLLGGLDMQEFEATVLFRRMPDPAIAARVQATGAKLLALEEGASQPGSGDGLPKYNLQARIRRWFGPAIERVYESLKFLLFYARSRKPLYEALLGRFRQLGPDLVHFNVGLATDTPGILAARDAGIAVVSHVRDLDRITWLSVRASSSVKRFLCISTAVRDRLVDFGVRTEQCEIVPNAIEPARFDVDAATATDLAREFGCAASAPVFALVGRVVGWKGHEFFIQAIAEARQENTGIHGLIVGAPESSPGGEACMARLRTLVDELDLEDAITFGGHRTDVAGIMKAVDGVVCASSSPEPFGRVIIESMAVGTPVIATKAGGTTDIIDNEQNGLLVAIRDSSALAAAMIRLANDESLASRLRSAGLRTVEDRYTVAAHVRQVTDIYRAVLN